MSDTSRTDAAYQTLREGLDHGHGLEHCFRVAIAPLERELAALRQQLEADKMLRLNNALFVEQWERLCTILGIEKCSVIEAVDTVEVERVNKTLLRETIVRMEGTLIDERKAREQIALKHQVACDTIERMKKNDALIESEFHARESMTRGLNRRAEAAEARVKELERREIGLAGKILRLEAAEQDAVRLDAERMRMADALREILDTFTTPDDIQANNMKTIAVRAFTKPLDAAIDAARKEQK